MKNKKVNAINIVGLLIAAACFIYLFVIYLIMFVAEPNNYALRMATGLGEDYALKIFVCIAMFVVCLAEIVCLPIYFFAKLGGRSPSRQKTTGAIIIIGAVINLILVIIFWSSLGGVFDGNAANAESTIYRIIDLVLSIILAAPIWMLVGYSPRYDRLLELKKKQNRI